MFLYFNRPWADWFALVLFVGAAVTDWFDGYLARAWKQETKLGAMLDPIADKAMVVIALLVITGFSGMNPWILLPATLILFREVFVSGLREFLGATAGHAQGDEAGQVEDDGADGRDRRPVCAGRFEHYFGISTVGMDDETVAGVSERHGVRRTACAGSRRRMSGPRSSGRLLWVAALLTVDHRLGLFPQGAALSEGRTMIDVLYFAWVRERIGLPKERVETDAATVAELVDELRAREERYAAAFADLAALRVALDQELADFDAPLARRARGGVLPADDGRLSRVIVQPSAVRPRRASCTASPRGRADAGAVVTFTGIVRDDRRAAGDGDRALSRHDREGARADRAERRSSAGRSTDALVIHRHGRLAPGEPIMMVATAAAPPRRRLRRGRVPDGLPEVPRALLEEGAPRWPATPGSRPRTPTRPRSTAGIAPDR